MRYLNPSSRSLDAHRRFATATLGIAVFVVLACRGAVAATCDPPGPPPRFGCQWSVTECTWFCAVCDPLGSPPRPSCHWDLNVCNWICPGYTGVDVMVRTLQSPTLDRTVYVRLSSLCGSTGAAASCNGAFAVHPGMPLSAKCESLAAAVAAHCAAAGYVVSANECPSAATFTASNAGCPGTQFALGVSNDAGVFDQTATGPLPDGEVESICGPAPGSARGLRLEKLAGGAGLHVTWTDAANANGYVLFADQTAGGSFDTAVGTADSGTTGLTVPMPSAGEFFLVASSNSTCGVGAKR